MGYLAENAVFMPLTKTILEESDKFTCGNEDLDDFFQNDSIAYAEDLFGKTYCFQMKENVKELLCAFTVSNASIFTMLLPNARKKKVAKNVSYVKRDLIEMNPQSWTQHLLFIWKTRRGTEVRKRTMEGNKF